MGSLLGGRRRAPYWPWAQVIGTFAEGCDDEILAACLGAEAASIAQLVPSLAQRLGTTLTRPAASPASEAARFYLFQAVAGFLRQAASVQPLLVVLDDLHTADHPSILLLQFLAGDLRGSHLLVVGTYRDLGTARPPDRSQAVRQLVREGQLISLRGLGRDEVKELIERFSGVAASQATVAAIHEATEGNPLFIRETVRLLATEHRLERPGRLSVPVPGSVRAVIIQQRLAPLSADALQVLSAAAVVGREFDLALVRPVCELPVERVLGGLSEAVTSGVVTEEAGAANRYRFSHSLMREVLYDQLPIPARTELHRRVGEAIESLFGSGSSAHAAELARHFGEVAAAGEAAKALAYARQAGEQAMSVHAYEQAAAEYQRALHACTFIGPDEPVRCELLLGLGAAQARAGRYREAEESCLEAAELEQEARLNRAAGTRRPRVRGAAGHGR